MQSKHRHLQKSSIAEELATLRHFSLEDFCKKIVLSLGASPERDPEVCTLFQSQQSSRGRAKSAGRKAVSKQTAGDFSH